MPYADAGGIRLYYESLGEGTPLILHGHGLRRLLTQRHPQLIAQVAQHLVRIQASPPRPPIGRKPAEPGMEIPAGVLLP